MRVRSSNVDPACHAGCRRTKSTSGGRQTKHPLECIAAPVANGYPRQGEQIGCRSHGPWAVGTCISEAGFLDRIANPVVDVAIGIRKSRDGLPDQRLAGRFAFRDLTATSFRSYFSKWGMSHRMRADRY